MVCPSACGAALYLFLLLSSFSISTSIPISTPISSRALSLCKSLPGATGQLVRKLAQPATIYNLVSRGYHPLSWDPLSWDPLSVET